MVFLYLILLCFFFKVFIIVAKKINLFFDSLFEVYVISSIGLKQNFFSTEELFGIALKYMSYLVYI